MEKNKTNLNIRNVPTDLHWAFKAWCALHRKTISEAIIEYMEQATKEDKNAL